ncbi:MAG: hypothetical protein QOI77_2475 [Blastocatellia bacterium]|jgi:uncharacterized membrane protein|nr:hypothetical protein [Blastocatellia bacterium]
MATPYEPPPAPPSSAPGGTTSIGIDANLASMLCYLTMICCGLGIIVSLVFFIVEKTNRLLRFHALQGLLFGGVWVVVGIAFKILSIVLSIGDLDLGLILWGLLLVRILIALFLLVLLILAAIKAYQGQYYKLPIIGDIAWNVVNK